MPKSDEEGEMVKIYWSIDKDAVDISPLSYPPIRKDGWIAAGLLQGVGSLEIVSKKTQIFFLLPTGVCIACFTQCRQLTN